MNVDHAREVLGLASTLLTYPDPERSGGPDEVRALARDLPRGPRHRFYAFARYLEEGDLVRLQEEYVRAFDLEGGASPYLTHVRLGDDRSRGTALVRFKERYRAAGFEPLPTELPDFLPLVLEFLSLAEPSAAASLARDESATLERIAERLGRIGSPYRLLVEAAAEAAGTLAATAREGAPGP